MACFTIVVAARAGGVAGFATVVGPRAAGGACFHAAAGEEFGAGADLAVFWGCERVEAVGKKPHTRHGFPASRSKPHFGQELLKSSESSWGMLPSLHYIDRIGVCVEAAQAEFTRSLGSARRMRVVAMDCVDNSIVCVLTDCIACRRVAREQR